MACPTLEAHPVACIQDSLQTCLEKHQRKLPKLWPDGAQCKNSTVIPVPHICYGAIRMYTHDFELTLINVPTFAHLFVQSSSKGVINTGRKGRDGGVELPQEEGPQQATKIPQEGTDNQLTEEEEAHFRLRE